MKPFALSGLILLFASYLSFSQNPPNDLVPKEIKFDRNVVQQVNDNKKGILSYYFTASGDFAALRAGEKAKSLIIYNKEGKMFIVDEKGKSIIIMDMKGMITGAMKKGEDMAKEKSDSTTVNGKASFKKTGNKKTICNYPGEEYEVITEKGKMNIWYIKTDFVSFPALSMGITPGKKPASDEMGDLPALGKNYLMAEMEKDDKKVIETVSINKTDFTFSSAGYSVRDMSDLLKGKSN